MTFLAKAGLAVVLVFGAGAGGVAYMQGVTRTDSVSVVTLPLTITSANGAHVFVVESAKTADEQQRGLMYRTDLKPDCGMLFWPYPADGGPPRDADFWMKSELIAERVALVGRLHPLVVDAYRSIAGADHRPIGHCLRSLGPRKSGP